MFFGACADEGRIVDSRLEGSWQETNGRYVSWALGILPLEFTSRDFSPGADEPTILTFRKNGSIDWARVENLFGRPDWNLVAKGDRAEAEGPDGDTEYIELTEARYRRDSTRIELTTFEDARKLFDSVTLEVWLSWTSPSDRLHVRYVGRNPMGLPYHREYRGSFSRIQSSQGENSVPQATNTERE